MVRRLKFFFNGALILIFFSDRLLEVLRSPKILLEYEDEEQGGTVEDHDFDCLDEYRKEY